MAIPNWLYISNTSGGSGTTIITVSADTNESGELNELLTVKSGTKQVYILVKQEYQPENDYLTFDIISGGTLYWKCSNNNSKTISYSKNNSAWTNITSTYSSTSISVSAGDTIRFKGNNSKYGTTDINGYNCFSGTPIFNVFGNLSSLVYGDEYEQYNELTDTYAFNQFFYGSNVKDASRLKLFSNTTDYCYRRLFWLCKRLENPPVLPATTLSNRCYYGMFENCWSLQTAPELPATTLAVGCYQQMYFECSGLTSVPSNYLPVTTLADRCYYSMFEKCSSLTSAPELPAATLKSYCYYTMFGRCTSLSYVKCLATDLTATNCTNSWMYNVSSSGTFVKKSGVTWSSGDNGIPNNWTVQEV